VNGQAGALDANVDGAQRGCAFSAESEGVIRRRIGGDVEEGAIEIVFVDDGAASSLVGDEL
jgi:hypothetical protein